MKRNNIRIDGLNISYLEENCHQKESILFIHGNSLNAALFENLLLSQHLKDYRMIALDLPGNGQSQHSKNPTADYTFHSLCATMVELVNVLKLEQLILFGHSLGGHLAVMLLPALKEKVKGVIKLCSPPLSSLKDIPSAFGAHPSMQYAFAGELTNEEMHILASGYGKEENSKEFVSAIKQSDPKFRDSLGTELSGEFYPNEIEIMNNFKGEILLLQGEESPLENKSYLINLPITNLHTEKIVIIKDGSHSCFLDCKEDVLNITSNYLKSLK